MKNTLKEIEIAEKIWQENEVYIRKLCNYKLQSHPDLIDDCMQDVFLALITAVHDETEINNHKAWLTKVTVNKINDIYRDEKKKSENQVSLDDEKTALTTDFDYSYTEEISEKELDKHLQTILQSLTDKEKSLIEDFYRNNLSGREIAEKLDISETNVRQQIFRLKRKVIKIVKEIFE